MRSWNSFDQKRRGQPELSDNYVIEVVSLSKLKLMLRIPTQHISVDCMVYSMYKFFNNSMMNI